MKLKKKQQKMMNNKIQNLKNMQLNFIFLIVSDFFIDLPSKQIKLNGLIINKNDFNSLFFVQGIDEVFVDNT